MNIVAIIELLFDISMVVVHVVEPSDDITMVEHVNAESITVPRALHRAE